MTQTPEQHFAFALRHSHLLLWSEEFYQLTSAGFIPSALEASQLCTSSSAHENREETLPGAGRSESESGAGEAAQRRDRDQHPSPAAPGRVPIRSQPSEIKGFRGTGLEISPNLTAGLLLVLPDHKWTGWNTQMCHKWAAESHDPI